ncbi:hypothetical protein MKW98_010005 [Papaver atlanticum]|uniref:Uncharacterized protein n=1 Tax=Papaver atlanticum TaxID=357466 RepID=A0AAD4X5E4_9MAGN|nr:hypothetical protein MKW98_010005 [Papaver atlanticum]
MPKLFSSVIIQHCNSTCINVASSVVWACVDSGVFIQGFDTEQVNYDELEEDGNELRKAEASLGYLCNLWPHRQKLYASKAPARHPIYENFHVMCQYSYIACGLVSVGMDKPSMAFSDLDFTIRRKEPELIVPAKPTPYESKYLSDIDDRKGHHFHTPTVHFYRNKTDISMASTCKTYDIVDVIKKALANTLVFYYPFAGRLREAPGEKLLVECTGQGVLFVEADTDVSLGQLGGDFLKPPFRYLEQLVYAPAEAEDILHCPLLIIQVTRLVCGGFIVGFSNNHAICDAQGLHQFKTALAEIARGGPYPSILPVWERELLNARDPPQVTFAHREYDVVSNYKEIPPSLDDMVQHSFFFGPKELTALRQQVPPHLQACTTFEFITALLWRCRTIAIGYDPKEEIRVAIAVNTRGKFRTPLPVGFYGNAVVYPVAVSTTEKLIQNPLSYALELVKKAKDEVNEEYIRSTADLMSIKGRPIISTVRTYFVSDLRRVWNASEVDFGCGEVVYGGQAIGNKPTSNHWMSSYYMSHKNNKGEKGCLVPVCLPTLAMKKFVVEIESMMIKMPTDQAIQPETSWQL